MLLRHFILLIYLLVLGASPGLAQVMPLPQKASEIDDDPEAPEIGDLDATGVEDEELSYSSLELREGADYGVALSIGASMPWQSFGLDIKYLQSPELTIDWQTGYMEGRFSNRRDDVSYGVNYVALSTYVGAQWFLTDSLPIYVEPILGVVRWDGRIKAIGAVDQPLTADQALSGAFTYAAPFVGGSIGLLQVWASGWFLEYALLGAGIAGPAMENSFTPSNSPNKSYVKNTLSKVSTWGLINLKIGYFF